MQLTAFEGPLDLLLQLIESQKLSINDISLVEVTEPFLQLLETQRESLTLEDLADFLAVASRLLVLKARTLLPVVIEEEEGVSLRSQLEVFQRFVEAGRDLVHAWSGGQAWPRPVQSFPERVAQGLPEGVTADRFADLMRGLIRRHEPKPAARDLLLRRVVSLEERISGLRERLRTLVRTTFAEWIEGETDPAFLIPSFLAVLELAKQRELAVQQGDLFGDIILERV